MGMGSTYDRDTADDEARGVGRDNQRYARGDFEGIQEIPRCGADTGQGGIDGTTVGQQIDDQGDKFRGNEVQGKEDDELHEERAHQPCQYGVEGREQYSEHGRPLGRQDDEQGNRSPCEGHSGLHNGFVVVDERAMGFHGDGLAYDGKRGLWASARMGRCGEIAQRGH